MSGWYPVGWVEGLVTIGGVDCGRLGSYLGGVYPFCFRFPALVVM